MCKKHCEDCNMKDVEYWRECYKLIELSMSFEEYLQGFYEACPRNGD